MFLIVPGAGSLAEGLSALNSLRRVMRSRNGWPSPAQNQSPRLQLITRLENTMLLIAPPKVLFNASPRFTLLKRQSTTRMSRIATRLPSLNLIAADADESRQLVTTTCSQIFAGPQESCDTN